MKNHPKKSTESDQNKPIDRRKALVKIGNTVTGIVGVGSIGVMYRFLFPDVSNCNYVNLIEMIDFIKSNKFYFYEKSLY